MIYFYELYSAHYGVMLSKSLFFSLGITELVSMATLMGYHNPRAIKVSTSPLNRHSCPVH